MICRKCGEEDETLEHIVNCGKEHTVDTQVIYDAAENFSYDIKLQLIVLSSRIENFLEEFKEPREEQLNG